MEDEEKKTLASADIMKIMKLLPHRYPFLLIDKIIEMDGDNSCIGIKNVTINEPHFTGHFPERPVFPGVLLIEAMAQTAGALCVHARGDDAPPQLVYFMTIDKAKFRKDLSSRVTRFIFTSRRSNSAPISGSLMRSPRWTAKR